MNRTSSLFGLRTYWEYAVEQPYLYEASMRRVRARVLVLGISCCPVKYLDVLSVEARFLGVAATVAVRPIKLVAGTVGRIDEDQFRQTGVCVSIPNLEMDVTSGLPVIENTVQSVER